MAAQFTSWYNVREIIQSCKTHCSTCFIELVKLVIMCLRCRFHGLWKELNVHGVICTEIVFPLQCAVWVPWIYATWNNNRYDKLQVLITYMNSKKFLFLYESLSMCRLILLQLVLCTIENPFSAGWTNCQDLQKVLVLVLEVLWVLFFLHDLFFSSNYIRHKHTTRAAWLCVLARLN